MISCNNNDVNEKVNLSLTRLCPIVNFLRETSHSRLIPFIPLNVPRFSFSSP